MKIICVGRNYADHAKELGNEVPEEPVLFLKPDTALMRKRDKFYIPDFSGDIHYELELVLRINRIGKRIQSRYADKYFNQISVGIDFTARDLQAELKYKGLPWEKSKAFDLSAAVGDFIDVTSDKDMSNLHFELKKNGETVQQGNTADMIFTCGQIIENASKYFTLKIGDLIYTGTPKGVGKVVPGDHLEGYLEGQKLLSVAVR